MTTEAPAPSRSRLGCLPPARYPSGIQPADTTLHAPAFARIAAETAEWLSQQIIQDCGTRALEIAQRLRVQARSYRELDEPAPAGSPSRG